VPPKLFERFLKRRRTRLSSLPYCIFRVECKTVGGDPTAPYEHQITRGTYLVCCKCKMKKQVVRPRFLPINPNMPRLFGAACFLSAGLLRKLLH